MKIVQKYLYLLLCFAVLLLIVIHGCMTEESMSAPLPSFIVHNPTNSASQDISIFHGNAEDYYVFLPSYADLDNVMITVPVNHHFSIDAVTLTDGMNCGAFAFDLPYTFMIDDQTAATLRFLQSENIATVYIETATGSMKRIHNDKNIKENVSFVLYTSGGEINHSDTNSTLKGRGNSSWICDKRPYTLTLSADGNLLGMGAAKNWILLANAFDETNLNSKLTFSLASRVGFQWTPDCRWVDVYLNGVYNGLYLLAEKVEIHENRLNLDPTSEDFLCKIDLFERWNSLNNPFLTQIGRTVEICEPKTLTSKETNSVVESVNQMEQVILSGENLQASPVIDLDSFVRRYLIDEISGNIDSDHASSYYYSSDGILFAGPVWDYDLAFGNTLRNQEPHSFFAKNAQKADSVSSPYYSSLYANSSFYKRMKDIYFKEFRPVLQQMISTEIDCLAAFISKSARMNSIRWRSMYDEFQSWEPMAVHTVEELTEWLSVRVHFLDGAWLDGVDYCTVQFEISPGNFYFNTSVKQGECLQTAYLDPLSTTWFDTETKEIVDFSQIITKDMVVVSSLEANASLTPQLATVDYITFISLGILITLMVGFVIVDVARRREGRSTADEHY